MARSRNPTKINDRLSQQTLNILKTASIESDSNISIINNIDLLLEFIGSDGLKSSGKHNLLPMNQLNKLNSLMARPLPHDLKRPQQRSLPNLNGLFLLMRSSGLLRVEGVGSKAKLVVHPECWASWQNLNPTERYFALLKTWIFDASPTVLGERPSQSAGYFHQVFEFAQRDREPRMLEASDYANSVGQMLMHMLFEMFGWMELEYFPVEENKGVRIRSLKWTEFGGAMLDAINHQYFNNTIRTLLETTSDEFRQFYVKSFPELQNGFAAEQHSYQDGTFVWKVSVWEAWRRIEAPADMVLDDLAEWVLHAFDFENDHLYCYYLKDDRGNQIQYDHPSCCESNFCTVDTEMGELPIQVKQEMIFHFDFGHDWRFSCLLEEVKPERLEQPGITGTHGEPPIQYEWHNES